VVTENTLFTQPIVRVAEVEVEYIFDEVNLTVAVSPLFIVPVAIVYEPLFILYCHQIIVIVEPVFVPLIVIVFDS
jgi:hypothetical protein